MPEQYRTNDILRLLEELGEETGTGTGHAHFEKIYNKMRESEERPPFVSEDYLYRKLYRRAKRAKEKGQTEISLNVQNIEYIARFLGYSGYLQFERTEHPDKNPVLFNCVGNWYSYVRCNSGNPDILISPVQITANGKQVRMELKGPQRKFEGPMTISGPCLYCNLESGKEKRLNLIFKIGTAVEANVLQGVFSGVSSGGDPIAGRELLIRRKEKFKELANSKIGIKDASESDDEELKTVAAYFSSMEKNILRGGRASTFGIADLKEF